MKTERSEVFSAESHMMRLYVARKDDVMMSGNRAGITIAPVLRNRCGDADGTAGQPCGGAASIDNVFTARDRRTGRMKRPYDTMANPTTWKPEDFPCTLYVCAFSAPAPR